MKFLEKHAKLVKLVLDSTSVDAVIGQIPSDDFGPASAQVCALVNSGDLVFALLHGKWQSCRGLQFSERVTKCLDAFEKMAHSTKVLALSGTRESLASLALEASIDRCFVLTPVAKVQFLGVELNVPTADASTEVMFRLEALLRNHSIGYKGGVRALPHETWLFPTRGSAKAAIPAKELSENDCAREHFCLQASRSACENLCDLVDLVNGKKAKAYTDVDPDFLLEMLYLRHHAEEECSKYVSKHLLACLPSAERAMSVEQSLILVRSLQETPMLRTGGLVDSIQRIEAVLEELGQIAGATGPSLGDAPSEQKKQLFERYAYFFVWQFTFQVTEEQAAIRLCEDQMASTCVFEFSSTCSQRMPLSPAS